MKTLATLALLVFVGATTPYEQASWQTPTNAVDELVFGQLRRLRIEAAKPCSDAVFLRRAYLDVIGTLPTPQEANEFFADQQQGKRRMLIDRLLEREEFADYQAMRWCDALRVKSEFPINLWPNAVQAYHRWILTSIRGNKRYDVFVRDMLTASGSNFRVPQVNFYRAVQSKQPQAIAQAVALSFMGCRAENWPTQRLEEMAAFFEQIGFKATAEWKEEIVFFDSSAAATRPADFAQAMYPDGTAAHLRSDHDPREDFAAWLTAAKNPFFARAVVNRIWFWLLGRGIVQECDDFRPDNPPSNPALLALLERELIARFDLKHIYRLILNSRTYQLSAIRADDSSAAAANFAHYPLRRVEAEVLIDAICQITGTTEKYSSAVPEPYTFMPDEQRAVDLPDGSITSSFLELFGRTARDTGMGSERNNRATADQRLHLLNSTHVQRKLEQGPRLRALMRMKAKDRVPQMYLLILSRHPTETETQAARAYVTAKAASEREGWIDLAWALINSPEFLLRH